MCNYVNITPIDFKPNVAVGISIPFNGTSVFNSTYTTKDQLRSNIINFFLTNKNERIFNVSFGGNLRSILFEQIGKTFSDTTKDTVEGILSKYFPQIIITELTINENLDNKSVVINLNYKINNRL